MFRKSKKKAVFFDRDGIINVDTGYPIDPEKIRLVPYIVDLIKFFRDRDYLIIVVSNQSGVARGYFTQSQVSKFNCALNNKISILGGLIDDFFICPHHPSFRNTSSLVSHEDHCNCRKPKIGMLKRAEERYDIDLQRSILIGDNDSDIECAINARLDRAYKVSEMHVNKNFVSNDVVVFYVTSLCQIEKNERKLDVTL